MRTGFDIDIMEAFGEYLGRPVEFSEHPFPDIWLLPNEEVCDVAAAAITIRQSRIDAGAAFSYPYMDADIVLLSRAGEPTMLDEICIDGGTLGVGVGTTFEALAKERAIPLGCRLALYGSTEQVDEALLNGDIDATLQDSPAAAFKVQENARLGLTPLEIGMTLLTGDQYGYATSVGFLSTLNDFVCESIASGLYTMIFQKYFGDAQQPDIPAECPMPILRSRDRQGVSAQSAEYQAGFAAAMEAMAKASKQKQNAPKQRRRVVGRYNPRQRQSPIKYGRY